MAKGIPTPKIAPKAFEDRAAVEDAVTGSSGLGTGDTGGGAGSC